MAPGHQGAWRRGQGLSAFAPPGPSVPIGRSYPGPSLLTFSPGSGILSVRPSVHRSSVQLLRSWKSDVPAEASAHGRCSVDVALAGHPENWVGLDRWVSPGKAFMGAAWCGPDVPDTACKSLAGGGGSVT